MDCYFLCGGACSALTAHTLGVSGPLSRLLMCLKLVKCFFFLIGCSGSVLSVSRGCEAAMESYY